MNPTIVKIINLMFRGIPETPDTASLREELLTNSQARYDDLIASGLSADDALGQVMDSLRGMEDVLDDFRSQKAAKPGKAPTFSDDPFDTFERMVDEHSNDWERLAGQAEATAKSAMDAANAAMRNATAQLNSIFKNKPREMDIHIHDTGRPDDDLHATFLIDAREDGDSLHFVYDPAQVQRLHVQLIGEDMEVVPSYDGRIYISIDKEDESLYQATLEDGLLTFRRDPLAEPRPSQPEQEAQPQELEGFSGIMRGISQALKGVFNVVRTNCGGTLHLALPASVISAELTGTSGDFSLNDVQGQSLHITTTSGDVSMEDCSFSGSVSLGGTSGDVNLESNVFTGPVSLSTTSGDIDFISTAPQLSVNAVSGDMYIDGAVTHLRLNSVSGDIDVTAQPGLNALQANTTSGDIDIRLPHGMVANVQTNTMGGDIDISCPTSEASTIRISLNSVSGDIDVDTDD